MKISAKKRIMAGAMTAVMGASMLSAAVVKANAATILSDCTEEGYYMASPENSVRSSVRGDIIGHLDEVAVYKLDESNFIKDETTGLTWAKIKATIAETEEKADGYICLSYCYYMGTDENTHVYEAVNETPAQRSFYSDSEVLDFLEVGERIVLLDTGDAQLFSPESGVWVNAEDVEETKYTSAYEDYSGLSCSLNTDAFYNENQQIIFKHFLAKGFPVASACAIAVNAQAESGCNPDIGGIDTNGLYSYGLFQWNGSRKDRLEAWCEEYGYDASDIYAQLKYLDWELQYCYQGVYDSMLDESISAYDAAYIWASKFEVCASRFWNGRAAEAESIYDSLIADSE